MLTKLLNTQGNRLSAQESLDSAQEAFVSAHQIVEFALLSNQF